MRLLETIRKRLTGDEDAALIRRAEEDFEQLDPKELRRLKTIREARESRAAAVADSVSGQE